MCPLCENPGRLNPLESSEPIWACTGIALSFFFFKCMAHVKLFPTVNVLYFYISISRIMCAVPNMTVFCSFSISCFLGMLFRCFLNYFQIFPVCVLLLVITFVFIIIIIIIIIIINNNNNDNNVIS